ncbi:hypothetical protein UA08_04976 [Talaromyces atroroseus]|uniref:Zn(2)-C6 fungal-type domain-containing protein n=1 Tax=Talaromyces atroroseus TaxID=1441469 RepID=A0A225AFE1_TALAT|nr:hypothetical protein UA08_04976 [Talaromyces atroroseus]OKL60042.1 hypothetical protein UA08_04976 [Talaromyces atroroseus]
MPPNDYSSRPIPSKDTSTRAWLIVAGGLLIYFPTFGFLNAFGTFQTYYEQDLLAGTSSSKIAWIGSLQIFLLFIGGLVVGPLYDKVGATRLLVPGAVIYVTSLMLTSVCKKYYQLILAQGIAFGCANALLFYPTIAAINQWFDKQRGIALGLAVSGSSLGGIFWTELISYMFKKIGFGWSVRACGFISLAFVIPSCFLIITRPPEPGESEDSKVDFKEILYNKTYILFSLGMLLVLWGMFIPFFYLPSYGESYGMSTAAANNLLAYMNAGSFLGRVFTGILSDRIGRFNMISLASLSCGILLFCLHRITAPGAIVAFSVLYGICSGGLISLQSACIGQITPAHNIIGVRIGLMMAFCSIGGLTGSPIAGALLTTDHGKWYGFIDFCAFILTGGAVVTIVSRLANMPILYIKLIGPIRSIHLGDDDVKRSSHLATTTLGQTCGKCLMVTRFTIDITSQIPHMAKTSELRRSCGLCRSRKIACSGETICKACRERSIECVYDLETPKGRPRSHKNDAAASNRSNVGDSDSAAASISISVMAELDVMFRENFGAEPVAAPSNLFHERVASFNRNLAAGKARHDASTPPGTLTYPAFLALLTQDLVETVAVKFGNLDCQPFFGPGERFYRACMLQDTIDSMFEASESLPCSSDVLDEYSPSLITQHLEVWFNNHPLSIIISKTLLLREIRNDSANQVLLGVLLADAHHFSDDSAREDRMLKWAISQLYLLSANKADIITAQITLLLGWYHACRCHSRRALCYIGYACRIATMLKCQLHESSSRNQTQINGIDHGAVEAEVIHNICWVALAITTWAFIQMDMSLADLLPAGLMQVLPASTEADSMLLQLDRATHNLSTLKHQISSLQSVWLLSHVTSLSANMYALYPRLSSGRQPESHPWQDLVLRRLDHLLHQGRSLAQICSDSRDAILDVIALVQTQHLESKAASALLAFYHALSIQLLFPHGKDQSNCHPPVLSDILFQKLSKSMHGLKQLFPAIQSVAKQNAAQPTNIASAALHFYILALDATGRALAHILAKLAPGEQISWQDRLAHLFDAGSALHGLFDDDVLLQDHRWRSVKRQLKVACTRRLNPRMANLATTIATQFITQDTHFQLQASYSAYQVVGSSW